VVRRAALQHEAAVAVLALDKARLADHIPHPRMAERAALPLAGDKAGAWITFPIFLIIMAEETLGRWLFYRLRQ